MATFRDLLLRLRPVGAPGAPSGIGVPADELESAEKELAPIFAELAGTSAECRRIRQQGAADAARIVAEAQQQAQQILARAQADATAQRAEAAAELRARASAEVAAAQGAAQREAESIRLRAGERLEEQVSAVLALIRRDLARLGEPSQRAGAP